VEVERTHTQLVDAYRELGARTAPFEAPGQEVGLRFLGWLQEELEVLPTIVMGLMSFASLVTCEGAVNALYREGCGHFEAFDQSDEGYKREIFLVEDPMMKRSAGALFDRMWGPHGRETVQERSDRAMDQVKVHLWGYGCGYVLFAKWVCYCCRWRMPKRLRTLVIWTARCPRHRGWSWRRHLMRARAPRRSPHRLELAKARASYCADGCGRLEGGGRTSCRRPGAFAGGGIGVRDLSVNFCFYDTEPRLLRRFRRLGLRKQPLLSILILWRPQT
jgi:hypothetical protein